MMMMIIITAAPRMLL